MNFRENMELICVMCEDTCKKNEMPKHRCLDGYKKFFIDAKTHYFYPMLDDGKTILRRSSTADDNEEILEKQENWNPNTPDPLEDNADLRRKVGGTTVRKSNTKKLTETETHLLILEIQERRPLWDFSLPLDQRNKELKQKLWEEVSEKLGGKLNPKEVQNKFKCLRDTHRKIIQTELQTNGSGKEYNQKWKHYEVMEFLRGSCMIKSTETNVTHEENIDNDLSTILPLGRSINYNEDSHESVNVTRKRQRRSSHKEAEDFQRAINKIPDVVCNDEGKSIILPPPPQPDEVDSILHAVGLQLRRIPYTKRMQTLIDIMRIASTKVAEENVNET